MGHSSLGNNVRHLCKKAGIPDYHSLRVSAVTRLSQKDVDKQLIMSVTSHRSIDSVRADKHVSEQQLSQHLQAKHATKRRTLLTLTMSLSLQ